MILKPIAPTCSRSALFPRIQQTCATSPLTRLPRARVLLSLPSLSRLHAVAPSLSPVRWRLRKISADAAVFPQRANMSSVFFSSLLQHAHTKDFYATPFSPLGLHVRAVTLPACRSFALRAHKIHFARRHARLQGVQRRVQICCTDSRAATETCPLLAFREFWPRIITAVFILHWIYLFCFSHCDFYHPSLELDFYTVVHFLSPILLLLIIPSPTVSNFQSFNISYLYAFAPSPFAPSNHPQSQSPWSQPPSFLSPPVSHRPWRHP